MSTVKSKTFSGLSWGNPNGEWSHLKHSDQVLACQIVKNVAEMWKSYAIMFVAFMKRMLNLLWFHDPENLNQIGCVCISVWCMLSGNKEGNPPCFGFPKFMPEFTQGKLLSEPWTGWIHDDTCMFGICCFDLLSVFCCLCFPSWSRCPGEDQSSPSRTETDFSLSRFRRLRACYTCWGRQRAFDGVSSAAAGWVTFLVLALTCPVGFPDFTGAEQDKFGDPISINQPFSNMKRLVGLVCTDNFRNISVPCGEGKTFAVLIYWWRVKYDMLSTQVFPPKVLEAVSVDSSLSWRKAQV